MTLVSWQYRYTVLGLCTLAFFVTMVARLAISTVVPDITAEFNVSNTMIGIALTGMWMAYSLAQFPSGVLADTFGERIIVLVAIGGTAVSSVILAIIPFFGLFFVFTVILGTAAGLHYTVATTLLTRTYDDLGKAVGVHNSGAPAAGLLTPVATVWIGSQYGWRLAVGLAGVISFPVFVLFALKIESAPPRCPRQSLRETFCFRQVIELLSRPSIAFTVSIAIGGTLVWQSVASFLPMFLIQYRGQSATFAGLVFSAYFVVQGIMQVSTGILSDKFGRDQTIATCMASASIGLGLYIVFPGLVAVIAGTILLGFGMSYAAAMLPRLMDNLSESEQGTGFGLVRTVYGTIAAFGPVVSGSLADVFSWGISFGMLIGLLSLIFWMILMNEILSLGY